MIDDGFYVKILFVTNNEISKNLINWLRNEAKEEVVVISEKMSMGIIDLYKPDLLISYNYKYIIQKHILTLLGNRAINLHISFLPWNKGAHPNIWSFVENTPKGVTIHYMDKGIDTGDILLQREVYIDEEKETLFSSYGILHSEIQDLFISNWDKLKTLEIIPRPQRGGGSIHYTKDLEKIKHLLGEESWQINIPTLKSRLKQLLNKT